MQSVEVRPLQNDLDLSQINLHFLGDFEPSIRANIIHNGKPNPA